MDGRESLIESINDAGIGSTSNDACNVVDNGNGNDSSSVNNTTINSVGGEDGGGDGGGFDDVNNFGVVGDRFHHLSKRSQLLTAEFNQDGGCLAVGFTNGFSVHNLHPQYNLSVERSLRGGIGQIEMLFRCNLMALVGGGTDPHAAPHRVLIWDDHVPKEIGELSFRQIVLKVKLRKDAIAVALRDRVYVYNLADLALRDKIYTSENPHGLLSLSTNVKDMVLACPSVTLGHVRIELYGLRKTMLIEAHESTLRAIRLTSDGGKLATASCKGTIIRVWDVSTSQCVYEFRRGVERAQITCLAFSIDDRWLSCSSDKGTTHIFHLDKTSTTGGSNNDTTTTKRKKKSIIRKNGSGTTTSATGANNGVSSSSSSDRSGGSSLVSSPSSFLSASGASRLLSMGSLMISASTASKSQPKSVCQIRGVPHPLSCAFIGDAPHLIAVAGWDNDGNGVLLICEFAAHQEARRVAYHVLIKNSSTADESEEEKRRRRARGWVPTGMIATLGGGGGTTVASQQHHNHIITDDDPMMHYGHLRVSDEMAEETHRFQINQTTDDDFCEVIVEPRRNDKNIKEPVIEDKPLSSSQEQQEQPQQNCNEIEEIDFTDTSMNKVVGDNIQNTEQQNNENTNGPKTTTTKKEIGTEDTSTSSFDKDSSSNQDSVPKKPSEEEEEEDGGKDNNES